MVLEKSDVSGTARKVFSKYDFWEAMWTTVISRLAGRDGDGMRGICVDMIVFISINTRASASNIGNNFKQ